MELEASKTTSDPETVEAETSVRPGKQVKRPSMSLTPNSKRSLQAPQDCRRVGKRKPSLPPLYGFSTAVESDGELVVPTSQSQDLRPFFVSPPRPGGTDPFTNTTPKALRQSSSAGRHFEASPKLSSQQQTGVFRTPTKPTSSSFNGMANVEK